MIYSHVTRSLKYGTFQEEYTQNSSKTTWQITGIQLPTTWKEDESYKIASLTEAVLYFIFEYYYSRETKLQGTHFTFHLSKFNLIYSPGSIHFSPQEICSSSCFESPLWNSNYFFPQIAEIDRITKYIGPVQSLPDYIEEIAFSLDPILANTSRNVSRDITNLLGNLLTRMTNLSRVGFYVVSKNLQIRTAFDKLGFLYYLELENIVAPQIKTFDYPVYIYQLFNLRKVFPNVKEPLIRGFSLSIENYKRNLDSHMGHFTAYRLLPNNKCPQELIGKYNMHIDEDNYYVKYTCLL